MIKNDKGIALVTSLMLTLICLTIILAAMYLMTIGTKQSGVAKSYKSALQASYGGGNMILKDVIPQLLLLATDAAMIHDVTANFNVGGAGLQLVPDFSTAQATICLNAKLQLPTAQWKTVCTQFPDTRLTSLKPKDLPDFRFTLPAVAGSTPYTIYSKIIDTVVGNSDMSGVNLGGAGVADGQNGITPEHVPYQFRVEVQAERSNSTVSATNPAETANLSVLYAY